MTLTSCGIHIYYILWPITMTWRKVSVLCSTMIIRYRSETLEISCSVNKTNTKLKNIYGDNFKTCGAMYHGKPTKGVVTRNSTKQITSITVYPIKNKLTIDTLTLMHPDITENNCSNYNVQMKEATGNVNVTLCRPYRYTLFLERGSFVSCPVLHLFEHCYRYLESKVRAHR